MAELWSHIFRTVDSIVLVLVIAAQSTFMNCFLIFRHQKTECVSNSTNCVLIGSKYYEVKDGHYLWFIADGLMIILCIVALILSHRHILPKFHDKIDHYDIPFIDVPMYGVLPFGYITWFLYASIVVAKVAVIFTSEIVDTLPAHLGWFSSITLKIDLSLSVLVFILLVNTHHNAEPNSDRNNYIADLCKGTAFDLFDSISFLDFLVETTSHLHSYPEYDTVQLRNTIIALSCINFLLPTLSLMKLSLSDFGEKEQPVKLSLISKTCKFFFINFPYMIVRIYLYKTDAAISVFLVKNVLYVLISLRYMIPEYISACKQSCSETDSEIRGSESFPSSVKSHKSAGKSQV